MALPKNEHIRHVLTEETLPLINQVEKHCALSAEEACALITIGAVYLEKKRTTDATREIKPGAYLRIHLEPRRYPVAEVDWKGCLLHETPDFIVIDKPAKVPVPSTVDNLFENVAFQMEKALGYPLYVTQRLDRPTTGVMVLARTKLFQAKYNTLLADRKVSKEYWALSFQPIEPGTYSHFIEDSKTVPKKIQTTPAHKYLACSLIVNTQTPLVAEGTALYRSSITLLTGRTHQIRAQFSYMGAPLVGDTPYNGVEKFGFNADHITLHAHRLVFEGMEFQSVPKDWPSE